MTRIELISAVIVVTRDTATSPRPIAAYRPALARLGRPLEFIYVVDGPLPRATQALRALKAAGEPVEILSFATPFGESAALTVGFRHAAGDVVFTLTPEVAGRRPTCCRGCSRRWTAATSWWRARDVRRSRRARRKFDQAVNALFGTSLHDIRCGVRVMRRRGRQGADRLRQPAPLPAAAGAGAGLRRARARTCRRCAPASGAPARRALDLSLLLDVVTIYFLLRFLKKPFRFFGGFGFAVLAVGALLTALAGGRRACSSACRWSTGRRWS